LQNTDKNVCYKKFRKEKIMSDLKKTSFDDMCDDDCINENTYHENEQNRSDVKVRLKKPKFNKKLISFLLAFLMLLTSINTDGLFAKATTVTKSGTVTWNSHTTGKYSVTYDGSTQRVFCIEKAKTGPDSGTTVTVQQYTGTTDSGKKVMRALYYYYQVACPCGGDRDSSKDIAIMHLILDHYVSGTTFSDSVAETYMNKIENAYALGYICYSSDFSLSQSRATAATKYTITGDSQVYYQTPEIKITTTDPNQVISFTVPNGWWANYDGTVYDGGKTVNMVNGKSVFFYCFGKTKSNTITLTSRPSVTAYRFYTSSDSVQDLAGVWGASTGKSLNLTISFTAIATNTPTPTNTPKPTNTPTNTPKPTNTPTNTPKPTNTPTPTNTPVPNYYASFKLKKVDADSSSGVNNAVYAVFDSSASNTNISAFVKTASAKTSASNAMSTTGNVTPVGFFKTSSSGAVSLVNKSGTAISYLSLGTSSTKSYKIAEIYSPSAYKRDDNIYTLSLKTTATSTSNALSGTTITDISVSKTGTGSGTTTNTTNLTSSGSTITAKDTTKEYFAKIKLKKVDADSSSSGVGDAVYAVFSSSASDKNIASFVSTASAKTSVSAAMSTTGSVTPLGFITTKSGEAVSLSTTLSLGTSTTASYKIAEIYSPDKYKRDDNIYKISLKTTATDTSNALSGTTITGISVSTTGTASGSTTNSNNLSYSGSTITAGDSAWIGVTLNKSYGIKKQYTRTNEKDGTDYSYYSVASQIGDVYSSVYDETACYYAIYESETDTKPIATAKVNTRLNKNNYYSTKMTVTTYGAGKGYFVKTVDNTNDTLYGLTPSAVYYVREVTYELFHSSKYGYDSSSDKNSYLNTSWTSTRFSTYYQSAFGYNVYGGSSASLTYARFTAPKTGRRTLSYYPSASNLYCNDSSSTAKPMMLDFYKTTSITLTKKTDTGKAIDWSDLEGAKFSLYYCQSASPSNKITTKSVTDKSEGYTTQTVTVSGGSATNTEISSSDSIVLIGTFTVTNGQLVATANTIKNGDYSYTASRTTTTTKYDTLSYLPQGYYTLVETKVPYTYGVSANANWTFGGDYKELTTKTLTLTESTAGLKVYKIVTDGSTSDGVYSRSSKYNVFSSFYDTAIKGVTYTLYDTNGTALATFKGSSNGKSNGYTCRISSNATAQYCMFASITTAGKNAGLTTGTGTHTYSNHSAYQTSHTDKILGLKANTTYYLKETLTDTAATVFEPATTRLKDSLTNKVLKNDGDKYIVTTDEAGSVKEVQYNSGISLDEISLNFTKSTSVTVSKKDKNGNNLINSDLDGTVFNLYYRPSLSSKPVVSMGSINYDDNGYITRTAEAGTDTYLIGTFTIKNGKLVAEAKTISKTVTRPDGDTTKGNKDGTQTYSYKATVSGTTLTNLPVGYYQLVEVKVPSNSGYTLASPLPKLITGSETTDLYTFPITEPSLGDPVEITVEKESGNSLEAPKSLEGTVFEVKYYQNMSYTSLDEISSKKASATYTWYIQALTDDDIEDTTVYKAKLDETHLLKTWNGKTSSDLLSTGLTTGTVTIKEVEAAEGYITGSGSLTDEDGTSYDEETFIGYMKFDDTTKTYKLTRYGENGSSTVTDSLKLILTNDEYRGDLSFTKADSDTQEVMSDVKFKLSLLDDSKNVVETKEITTDENGIFNSADDSELWFYNSSDEDSYDTNKVNKALGSLITGKYYKLEEVSCDANEDYRLIDSITFYLPTKEEITKYGGSYFMGVGAATAFDDIYVFYLRATVEDNRVVAELVSYLSSQKNQININELTTVINEPIKHMTISTTVQNDKYSDSDSSVVIVDEVSYSGLKLGASYIIKGIVMEKTITDGEVTVTPLKDDDGKYVWSCSDMFNAGAGGKGTVTVTFPEFTKKDGCAYVVYEYLYTAYNNKATSEPTFIKNEENNEDGNEDSNEGSNEDSDENSDEDSDYVYDTTGVVTDSEGNLVCHADADDEFQSGYIVNISTTATDDNTESHVGVVSDNTVLTDVIAYNGLAIADYKVVTKVMLDDGTALTDADGKEVEQTNYFTTDGYKGTYEVYQNIDSSELGGRSVIFYEYIYKVIYDGDEIISEEEIAKHESLTDTSQTVYFPKITTTLNFKSGSDYQYEGSATDFTDTVEVTNLVTGSNYKVKSVIYDKTAGTLYVSDDGETYLGEASLTAGEDYKATADVDFLVNTLGLGDHELVCYEYLYYVKTDVQTDEETGEETEIETEILVAVEEDMNNTAQTKVITVLPKLPSTGSRTGLIVNTLAVLLIGTGLFLCRRKKDTKQLQNEK
jgi:hypothetical protein